MFHVSSVIFNRRFGYGNRCSNCIALGLDLRISNERKCGVCTLLVQLQIDQNLSQMYLLAMKIITVFLLHCSGHNTFLSSSNFFYKTIYYKQKRCHSTTMLSILKSKWAGRRVQSGILPKLFPPQRYPGYFWVPTRVQFVNFVVEKNWKGLNIDKVLNSLYIIIFLILTSKFNFINNGFV